MHIVCISCRRHCICLSLFSSCSGTHVVGCTAVGVRLTARMGKSQPHEHPSKPQECPNRTPRAAVPGRDYLNDNNRCEADPLSTRINLIIPNALCSLQVRGANYLKDKKKIEAEGLEAELLNVDLVEVEEKFWNIAEVLPAVTNSTATFMFIMQARYFKPLGSRVRSRVGVFAWTGASGATRWTSVVPLS